MCISSPRAAPAPKPQIMGEAEDKEAPTLKLIGEGDDSSGGGDKVADAAGATNSEGSALTIPKKKGTGVVSV